MKGERIIYPCYFNSALKRGQGRRVALSGSMKDPTLGDLERAAKRAGLMFRAEQKHFPARWWLKEGRIVVTWSGSKEKLLRKLASHLGEGK